MIMGAQGSMTTGTETFHFPAAVGLTHLRVYDTAAPDGVTGGSPHVHLASAEAYIPIAGAGTVQTLSANGEETFELGPGAVVWFEPGVIHRLVNDDGRLELLVIMQNAGLPEAGDAVFTFADHILADELAYRDAASIYGLTEEERISSALARRDRAVEGFDALRSAYRSGDSRPFHVFLERAGALKRNLVPHWTSLVDAGPSRATRETTRRLQELEQGSISALTQARIGGATFDTRTTGIGMCGLLRASVPHYS